MLFIDAREIFRQIDRAHRDFTDEQIEFLANIVRLYRGEEPELARGCERAVRAAISRRRLRRRHGTLQGRHDRGDRGAGVEPQPGRYVGTEVEDLDDEIFEEKLAAAQLSCASSPLGRRR